MITLLIIVLGVAAAASLHLSKTGAVWGKPAAIVCALAAIVLSVGKTTLTGPKTAGEIMARYDSYQEICGEVLGASIAERHPGARVTFVLPPSLIPFGYRIVQEKLQETLEEKGLTVKLKKLETPEISKKAKDQIFSLLPEGTEMTAQQEEDFLRPMLADLIALEPIDLRGVLKGLEAEADVVVFMVAYPEPIQDARLPPKGSGPALIMLDIDIQEAIPLLEGTVLDTVVTGRKDSNIWRPGAKKPKDRQEAFKQHYEIITANN